MPLVLDGTNGVNASTGSLNLQTSGINAVTVNSAQAVTFANALAGSTGASLVLIQRQTPSSVATCDFTTGIDSTYDEYLFTLNNVVPANEASGLVVRVSEDSGSTWKSGASDYSWATNGTNDSGGSASTGTASDTSMYLAASGVSNTASEGGYNGEMRIFNPSGSTAKKVITALGGYYRTTSTILLVNAMSGRYKGSSNAVNGIRFLFASGNITSGTIALYGVKKS
jgi:hypothetical protein